MAVEQAPQASPSSPQPGEQSPPAAASAAPSAAASPSSPETGGSTTTATRPDWLPETFFDPATGPKVDDIRKAFTERDELRAFKAAEDSRKLTLPQKPEDYKLELPADFKAPEGVTVQFDEKDPLIAQARQAAQELGIDQAGFSRLLALHAGAIAGEQQQIDAAKAAEIAKLGPAGPARVTAISTWLESIGAPELKEAMWTANLITGFEKQMARFRSQGSAGFSQTGRDAADSKPSEEEYATWDYNEKRTYATTGKRPQRRAA